MCYARIIKHTLRCNVLPRPTWVPNESAGCDTTVCCTLSSPRSCGSDCEGPILSDGRPIPAWLRCSFGHRCCFVVVRGVSFRSCKCKCELPYKFHLYEPSPMQQRLQGQWDTGTFLWFSSSWRRSGFLSDAARCWTEHWRESGFPARPRRVAMAEAEANAARALERRGGSVIPHLSRGLPRNSQPLSLEIGLIRWNNGWHGSREPDARASPAGGAAHDAQRSRERSRAREWGHGY
ncbi:hypothetical protein B0H67DRAFT_320684 [Lasiosphaeris hirsuta]|uniref:Uncharacterized protein n=1 Tax=Lasiosphaeris hirsuta TaxID=260670 RepID=A0AA40A1U6_9PEZI|nr:hypothetical protein B0H67DRAFT_320684 [Lasiosphaeris hirsuta]